MRLAVNVNVIVSAMSTNSCLVIPSVNTIGTNTHTVVKVDAIMAPVTPPAPSTAAFLMEYPLAPQAIDVLNDHDRVIHKHTDAKRQSRQRDNV